MRNNPSQDAAKELWQEVLEKLADEVSRVAYLQIEAGTEAISLEGDHWSGRILTIDVESEAVMMIIPRQWVRRFLSNPARRAGTCVVTYHIRSPLKETPPPDLPGLLAQLECSDIPRLLRDYQEDVLREQAQNLQSILKHPKAQRRIIFRTRYLEAMIKTAVLKESSTDGRVGERKFRIVD